MKHVTLTSIEKAIEKVDHLEDDALDKLSETYSLAQTNLLAYLMSAAIEYDNEQLEGLIPYYFCLISEAFEQEGVKVNPITEESIDEFEQPFFEMLDAYFDNEDTEILESFCDQPTLTQFMSMEISTVDEDGSSLDDETATQVFIVTMAMIALMSRNVKS
ncbi:MAG: hypothetical protein KJ941_10940 [Bacteroidetes bacterium]|nr:hypothetical protein [Bacteroidota bacterium]